MEFPLPLPPLAPPALEPHHAGKRVPGGPDELGDSASSSSSSEGARRRSGPPPKQRGHATLDSSGRAKRGPDNALAPAAAAPPAAAAAAAAGGSGDSDADNDARDTFVTLFAEYQQQDGIVTGDDLRDIFDECGIDTTTEQLRELLGDQFDDVDFDIAEEVARQLQSAGGRAAVAGKAAADTDAKTTLNISFLQYLKLIATCARDPAITYNVTRPQLGVQPKELLIGTIGFIMLFTGGLLILVVAMLWVQSSNASEEASITRFGEAITSFISSYDDIFLDMLGSELMDLAGEISTFKDLRMLHRLGREEQQMRNVAAMLAQQTNMEVDAVVLADARRLAAHLTAHALADRKAMLHAAAALRILEHLTGAALAPLLSLHWRAVAVNASSGAIVFNSHPAELCNGTDAAAADCNLGIPCLRFSPAMAAVIHEATVDPAGQGTVAVSASFARSNINVCLMSAQRGLRDVAAREASVVVRSSRSLLREQLHVAEAGIVRPAGSGKVVTPTTLNFTLPHEISPGECYASRECAAIDEMLSNVLRTRQPESTVGTRDRAGDISLVAAAPTRHETAIVLVQPRAPILDDEIAKMIVMYAVLNHIRIFELGTTIELALILQNETTGELFQGSPFAWADDCLGPCVRSSFSLENAQVGYETRGQAYSITPDYRPEAVMGGVGFGALDITQVVLVVERDVLEIREMAMHSLTEMIDETNRQFTGTFEVQLVYNRGQLLTRTFDPRDPCPPTTQCRSAPGYGVVFRDDCRHCTRQERLPGIAVLHLTAPKLVAASGAGAAGSNASSVFEVSATIEDLGRWALQYRNEEGLFHRAIDYRGEDVLGFAGFNANFSTGFYLKVDASEVLQPIMERVYLSLGVSIGIVMVSLVALMLLSRNLLVKIEAEWLRYKEQITRQRQEFGELVREVLPPHIAEQALASELCYAETANVLTMFCEATNLTARLDDAWGPEAFARYTIYVQHLLDAIVDQFRLYRVRNFGDVSFFVCGLAEAFEGKKKREDHPVIRILSAATVLHELSSPRFAHFPHETALFESVFENAPPIDFPVPGGTLTERVGHVTMPLFKVGTHFANTTLHVMYVGKTPHFDAIGVAAALAYRMMTSCRPGCVHVTDAVKDQCEKIDAERVFHFAKGKSVVMRGRGSVLGYLVESVDLSVPQPIISKLHLRFAKRRITFADDPKERPDGSIFSGMTATTHSSKSTNSSY